MNIPNLYKEKLALDELSEKEAGFLRLRGFTDEEGQLRKKKAEQKNAAFLTRHPWESIAAGFKKKPEPKSIFAATIKMAPYWASAAVACLVIGALSLYSPDSAAPASPLSETAGERIKGADPLIFVYKKSNENGAVLLTDRSIVFPHDKLQISYVSGGSSHGAIISVDGNGVITQHYPDKKLSSGPLESAGENLLDFSYELDEAPYFERFIFVSSNGEIPLEPLGKAFASAKDSAELLKLDPSNYVPKNCNVAELLLLKGK